MTNFNLTFGILLINILGSTFRSILQTLLNLMYISIQLGDVQFSNVTLELRHKYFILIHDKKPT